MKVSQKQKVLSHLMTKGSITSFQAFDAYHITRLAAVIFKLRRAGFDIRSVDCKRRDADGSEIRWVEYRLAQ